MTRTPRITTTALASLLVLGCSTDSDEGGLDSIENADEDNDFDMVGRLDVDMTIDHTTVPGKISVVSMNAADMSPFDVLVSSDTGDIVLELHGPLDGATGLFDPLHERSQLIAGAGAGITGFTPPETGFYIALVRDAQDRAVPFTLQYSAAASANSRFDVGDELRGARNKAKDAAEAEADLARACDRWRKLMFEVSGEGVQMLDCGKPKVDADDGNATSRAKARIAIPASLGAPVRADDDGGQISATSAEDYLAQCETRLLAAKERLGDRLLGASCGFKSAVFLVVAGIESETITAQPQLFVAP